MGCGERERDLSFSFDKVRCSLGPPALRAFLQASADFVGRSDLPIVGLQARRLQPPLPPLFTVVAWRGACLLLSQGEGAAHNSTEVEEVPGLHLSGHASSFEVPGQAL